MSLKDLLYPPRCPFCGKIMEREEPCTDCLNRSTELTATVCKRCGAYPEDCGCFHRDYAFRRNVAAFIYADAPRNLLLRFKLRNKPQLVRFMSNRMYHHIVARLGNDYTAVTFVPQSVLRGIKRGYCPTRSLAEEIAQRMNLPCISTLKRRIGKQQKNLSGAQRWSNAQKNHLLRKDTSVSGKILLIDDLFTTGATLNACAALLKRAGADTVDCATFAIDVKKS